MQKDKISFRLEPIIIKSGWKPNQANGSFNLRSSNILINAIKINPITERRISLDSILTWPIVPNQKEIVFTIKIIKKKRMNPKMPPQKAEVKWLLDGIDRKALLLNFFFILPHFLIC